MKIGVSQPRVLVDVSHLALAAVTIAGDGTLHAGATARNSELAGNSDVRRNFAVLAEALLAGASGQLRNAATTAGNLMQRTRCPYFVDVTKPCNKREPGTRCPARAGFHRMHAVLGAFEACIATHPSDMAVALSALDAQVTVRGPEAERHIGLEAFYRLPGDTPDVETTLQAGEIITEVTVPPLPQGARSTYRKVRDRASYAFAVVSIAGLLKVENGSVSEVRIALGGVAAKPWRAHDAEARLLGGPATRDAFAAALDVELAAAQPLPQNAFKIALVRQLASSTLTELAEDGDAR